MTDTEVLDRQQELAQIVAEGLADPDLIEALAAYEMGEKEYLRAISGTISIKVYSGNSSNLSGESNAGLDRD